MYKLSYEKCVCFIFLVILAILSCTGFRIDSLAMTDISKRNSYTSSSSLNSRDFFDRLFSQTRYDTSSETQETSQNRYLAKRHLERHHRTRHHRLLRSHQAPLRERRPSGRIVIYDLRSPETPTTKQPSINEQFAQIPPSHVTPLSTPSIMARSQRSPDRNRQKKARTTCQKQDVARKAYLANTVVLARAESMSSNRVHNYSVSFKITGKIKNSFTPIDDRIRLSFSSENKNIDCAYEELRRSHDLVKAKIRQSEEYILFLNTYGAHNYSVFGTPVRVPRNELKKRRLMQRISRVISPNFGPFVPKIVSLNSTRTRNRKIRFECVTRGFPNPYIQWKKDGNVLYSNSSRVRITYKKQKTTLVIKNAQDVDQGGYECVAHLNGMNATAYRELDLPFTIPNSEKSKHGEDCEEKYRDTLCENGGTCFYMPTLKERGCICPEGYHGQTCALKTVSNQSSMYGNPTYTCKLGLSTKYYC